VLTDQQARIFQIFRDKLDPRWISAGQLRRKRGTGNCSRLRQSAAIVE
jgi:hypothetical protein